MSPIRSDRAWIRGALARLALLLIMTLTACRQAPIPTPAAQPTETGVSATATATQPSNLLPTLPATWTPVPTPTDTPQPTPLAKVLRRHADSSSPHISADGRYVVFESGGADLLDSDLPGCPDSGSGAMDQACPQVYLYDRQEKKMELVSTAPDGTPGNGFSSGTDLSADGRFVVFSSYATNLTETVTAAAVYPALYLRDRKKNTTLLVSSAGMRPAISADGNWIAYEGYADQGSVIALYDRQSGKSTTVSQADPAITGDALGPAGQSYSPSISGDGQWIAFWSWDGHLVTGDTSLCGSWNCGDLFLYDRTNKKMTRIAMDEGYGEGMTIFPTSLSADGRWLVSSNALYDRLANRKVELKQAGAKISADGRWLIYQQGPRVFVQAAPNSRAEQVTVASDKTPGNGVIVTSTACSGAPQCQREPAFSLSASGRFAAFDSTASNLAGDDPWLCAPVGIVPHNCADIFVRDRQTGQTEWITRPVRPADPSTDPPNTEVKPLDSLEMITQIQSVGQDGQNYSIRQQHIWYLQPQLWRFDTEATTYQGNTPTASQISVSGGGHAVYSYDALTNTLTISTGKLMHNQNPGLPEYGAADNIQSLLILFRFYKECYPQAAFLGDGDVIGGRKSSIIYLGESKCKAENEPHGIASIWVDQETLVVLRKVVQNPDGELHLYQMEVQSFIHNPVLKEDWFTNLAPADAKIVDQRK